jgi:hypothetical protein
MYEPSVYRSYKELFSSINEAQLSNQILDSIFYLKHSPSPPSDSCHLIYDSDTE